MIKIIKQTTIQTEKIMKIMLKECYKWRAKHKENNKY